MSDKEGRRKTRNKNGKDKAPRVPDVPAEEVAAAGDTGDASLTNAAETSIPTEEETRREETPVTADDSASGVPARGTAEGDGRESEEGREGGGSEGDRTDERREEVRTDRGDPETDRGDPATDRGDTATDRGDSATASGDSASSDEPTDTSEEKEKTYEDLLKEYEDAYAAVQEEIDFLTGAKTSLETNLTTAKKANISTRQGRKDKKEAIGELETQYEAITNRNVSFDEESENVRKLREAYIALVEKAETLKKEETEREARDKAREADDLIRNANGAKESLQTPYEKVAAYLKKRKILKAVGKGVVGITTTGVLLTAGYGLDHHWDDLTAKSAAVPPKGDTPTYEFNAEAQDIKDIQKALENVFGNTSTKIESIKAYGVVGDEHHVYLDAVSKAGNCVVDVNLGTLEKDLHSTEELITFMQNNGVETEQVATYYPLAAMTGSESVVESVKGHINDLFGSVVDEVYAKAKISSGKAGTVGAYDFLLSSEQGDIASWDNGVVIRTKQTNPRAIQKIFNAAFGEKTNEGFAARITVSKNAPKTLKPYAQSGIVLSLSNGESMTL